MMNKIMTVLILLFALNCKTAVNQTKMVNEEIVLIAKGNLYGSGEEGIIDQNLVIDNQNDWDSLIKKMNSVNKVSDGFSETNIDFSKHTIIAVFDMVKGSGGHSLELAVTYNSEKILVNTTKVAPNGMATSVMTQPYYIMKITKSDLPIIFTENKK